MSHPIAEAIERELAQWPNVAVAWHGPTFVEFRVGRRELGHVHGGHLADFPFPVRIREQLVAAGRIRPHYLHPETGWASFYITSPDDVPAVTELFRLSYERPWLSRPAPGAVQSV